MTASTDIFISYASKDRDAARLYAGAFESAGLSVWWDDALRAGEAWDETIETALREAKAVVVLWSPRSVGSRWVRAEATVADQNKTLMPVTIRACRRPVMFELTQTADLSHWRGNAKDAAWLAFLGDVLRKVGMHGADPEQAADPPAPAAALVARRLSLARIVPAVVLALAVLGAVLWALTRPTEAIVPAAAARNSIAVMPFANLTGDATKDYLGDGMAEELINTLARVPGLKVPARTSTFAYKGRNTDIRQIAKDLGVGAVLEGSVRSAGKRIRITAQLISASDGLHIWSQTYDEEFTDLFALQDKLAASIATALQPNLHGAVQTAVAQGPPTRDLEAYNLYLQGELLLQRISAANAVRAKANFEQALARDPKFARAWAGLAGSENAMASLGPPAEHLAVAERAARQALALDPNLASAHMALATIHAQRGDLVAAEPERRAAVSLAPNDGLVHIVGSAFLLGLGHVEQGLAEAKSAYELAPANPRVVAMAASAYATAGQDRAALKLADAAVDLGYPKDTWPLPAIHELSALRTGRFAEAAGHATKLLDLRDPEQARTAEVVRLVYAALADPGKRGAALAARTRLYPQPGVAATGAAAITNAPMCFKSMYYYALLGEIDAAYALDSQCDIALSTASGWYAGPPPGLGWFIPDLRAVRRDPRFLLSLSPIFREYFRKFGPPDDCDFKNDRLICR